MLNQTKSQNLMNPLEFWKQWNEMTGRMWIQAINNSKAAGTDSPDIYNSWVKSTSTMQDYVTNTLLDPREAWKLWLDTTMDIWRSAVNTGGDPLGVIADWVKLMENIQEQVHSGESLSIDPFTLFNEWYDAMSKPWSKVAEDIIASDQFLEFTSPFLESHSNLIGTFRHASEAYLKALRLPTLSDIAHVAELVVGLEEKVDNIEDAIEHVKEHSTSDPTTTTRLTDLEQRLNHIETKLDRTLALLEQVTARFTGQ